MTLLDRFLNSRLWDPSTWLGAILYFVVILLAATFVSRLLQAIVRRSLDRGDGRLVDRTEASFLLPLSRIGVHVVALTLYAHLVPGLRSLGTALLTGVSISAVVIGLAAQNTLGNLIAGISLLLYRPFNVGDRLQVSGPSGLESGTVESVALGYTILQTFDNRRVVVPNSVIANQISINLTRLSPRVMSIVPFSISYAADIDQARALVLELAAAHPAVEEVVGCPVVQLASSSVALSLRAWCADPVAAKQVEYDLYEQVKKRFDAEGIEIPFPTTKVLLEQPAAG